MICERCHTEKLKEYTVSFHLHKILENLNQTKMIGDISAVAWGWDGGSRKETDILRVIDMFITLTVVVFSQGYSYLKTYKIIHKL